MGDLSSCFNEDTADCCCGGAEVVDCEAGKTDGYAIPVEVAILSFFVKRKINEIYEQKKFILVLISEIKTRN